MNKFGAKEWAMFADAVVLTIVLFVEQLAPGALVIVKYLVAIWQPIVGLYIVLVFAHDIAKLRAGVR